MRVQNTQELYPYLRGELEDHIGHDLYRKVWVQGALQNKKKQLYGFVITLFPHGFGVYDQKFLHRVFVNFIRDKENGGYIIKNYDEVKSNVLGSVQQ